MKNEISRILEAAVDELKFRTSRSGGAGGQHVNKVETKVSLRWNVKKSEALKADKKEIVLVKLSALINKDGVLIINDESSRSQLKNKELVIAKWRTLIRQALKTKKKRKPTKPTKASLKKKRMEKETRSKLKQGRKKVKPEL
jgi:ribosome-associated protein